MHKSRLGGILIDCQTEDPEPAAAFWAAALGYPSKPRDPATPYVDLDTPARELYTVVQAVEHESRVHIDIETDDIEAEVRRLAGLGAREIGRIKSWVILEAPTGQRFCVVPVESAHFDDTANTWE
jgi:hypothetical protein